MKNLQGKVAAITGAGSGIGQALALHLAQRGCHLALSDINQQGLDETQAKLTSYAVTVTQQQVNVADEQAMYQWADEVEQQHGKVNLIFNNAGVALSGTLFDLLVRLLPSSYQRIFTQVVKSRAKKAQKKLNLPHP